ncbi:MAG: putative metal-binding motif-containing protein, partial [Phaeodactylibacter sp.]|nr:putative metal-binding motif-containing protein [Phaeodactylibacter sp.]
MKKIFTFIAFFLAFHFCSAQYFQATIVKDNNDLIFKIRPNPGGGDISTGWSDIEFFVRWSDSSPTFAFGAITVNNTDFPGVVIPNNGRNIQGTEVGYINNWFGISFSATPANTYTDGMEYEVFRVALNVPASSIPFELVHNSFFFPHYLALVSNSGTDLTNPDDIFFYGPDALICDPNCPATTFGNNHVDSGSIVVDWYADLDGDGFGDPDSSVRAAGQPSGYVANNTDCDDMFDTVFPGAPEICDALDNDCDGVVPADEIDDDGDGFSECEGDCDDALATVYPGAPELCEGIDNDCDGQVDEDIVFSDYYQDGDGDGYGDEFPVVDCQPPGANYVLLDGDCDDTDDTVFPGAPELCGGWDNDCDGVVPAGELDGDGDGFSECEGDCD